MIRRFQVRNFKSLTDVAVDLSPVTVLIGRSGTGKTNFIQAIRFLRDLLRSRDLNGECNRLGGYRRLAPASAASSDAIAFQVAFVVPNVDEEFVYTLAYRHVDPRHVDVVPSLHEEKLLFGNRTVFHQRAGWIAPPAVRVTPPEGEITLGTLTGVTEALYAHDFLTGQIGCYAFPDSVLVRDERAGPKLHGLDDVGDNFVGTFRDITADPKQLPAARQMLAVLRDLKPSLHAIELEMPGKDAISIVHRVNAHFLKFNLSQESEGFRRMFACLLALHQTPPKPVVMFDEPEKGLYHAGLPLLAEEFQNFAAKEKGQVILITHSPEFLDHFEPEQIRAVRMDGYSTRIGPVASDQMESLREHLLFPRELLTVEEPRIDEPALAE